jgi:hypothetical protein
LAKLPISSAARPDHESVDSDALSGITVGIDRCP